MTGNYRPTNGRQQQSYDATTATQCEATHPSNDDLQCLLSMNHENSRGTQHRARIGTGLSRRMILWGDEQLSPERYFAIGTPVKGGEIVSER